MDPDKMRTVELDEQSIEVIIELVIKAKAEEMIDMMLIKNSPSNRMISLTRLEMELVAAKNGRQ